MQKGFLENLVGGDHPTWYKHKKIDMWYVLICVHNLRWGLRTHLEIHVQGDGKHEHKCPHSLLRIYSSCTIHRTGTEKGNGGKRQQMSIAAVPMPDYSSSPQTGGGCDLTRSIYVFPCIQDARHWLVVQLGPGRENSTLYGSTWFPWVRQCSMLFWQKYPFAFAIWQKNAVSWMKRTTKQTKEDKREWGREKGVNISALFSMKTFAYISSHQKNLSNDLPFFHNSQNEIWRCFKSLESYQSASRMYLLEWTMNALG